MILTILLYATLALTALLLLRSVQNWARSKGYPLPPGPRGLPFVGNILDGPSQPSWITYNQWSKTYESPLVRFSILGKNIIICNTLKSATDLLDKRSAIYSSRPHLTMLVDLCGFVWTFGLQHYGQQWRTQRKLFHSQFNSQMVPRLRPIEEKTTLRFLYHLLETPDEFMQHTRLLVGAQVIEMTYGFRVQDYNNPYITAAEEALACVEKALTAGAYMVDFFPLLKHVPAWLPGAGFQRQAREWKQPILRMKEMAYANRLKQLTRLGADEGNDCLMNRLLKNLQKYDAAAAPYTEEDIKDVLGTAYAAGTDTVVAAMQFFMLAMVLYPEAQKKAQAEIDSVCADRLPEFDDMDAMPYIEAMVRETLRWHPVGPETIPHASTEDDVYEGYFIPKGSILVANTWAILHDETRYPDPFVFNPDRFMKDGELNPDVMNPDVTAFGFGRRVCPGRFMARESLWIMIARTLAVYDIRPRKDASGRPMMPTEEMNLGAVCDPKPFKCDIVPRSARHRDMMLTALRMSEAA